MSRTVVARVPLLLRYPHRIQGAASALLFARHDSHVHHKGYWNPDWRADPRIPRTQLEKIAAAKKYNLHPSDYKPFGEDDMNQHGDYPDLPAISYSERSPYEAWDMPEIRRNFGEPLHIDFDMYSGERCATERQHRSQLYMISSFLGFTGFFLVLMFLTRDVQVFVPQMPKHYPYNDLWVAKGGDPALAPQMKFYEI